MAEGVGPKVPRQSVNQLGLEGLGMAEERPDLLRFLGCELMVCEDPGEAIPFLSWWGNRSREIPPCGSRCPPLTRPRAA